MLWVESIVRNGNAMTIDLTKVQSHEAKMAVIHSLGLQSLALPEEIDKEFYDKLKVGGDIEIVSDYNERNCPSFFKREFFHKMFDKPV